MDYESVFNAFESFLTFEKFQEIKKQLKDDLTSYKHILIYGAGKGGRYTKYLLGRIGLTPNYFVDANAKNGDRIEGIRVLSPDNIEDLELTKEETVMIVSVGDSTIQRDVSKMLSEMGYFNIVSYIQLFNSVFLLADEKLASDVKVDYYISNKDDILSAFKLFKDEDSINIYTSFIKGHSSNGIFPFAEPCAGIKYKPLNLDINNDYSFFVDCGAGYGETYDALLSENDSKTVLMFEPDRINYEILMQKVKENESYNNTIYAWPCAVYSKTESIPFDHSATAGSNIYAQSNEMVQSVKLDQIMYNVQPTFIKMDVEGAEYEAVLGAQETICKSRPQLAICVYHAVNHIWDIPLLINSWNKEYDFYLRSHNIHGMNTVLYCVPRN